MKLTLILLLTASLISGSQDMDLSKRQDRKNWRVVNDGVMGGLSRGKLIETPEGLRFEGRVSLENNGGFASFREESGPRDLSGYKGVRVKVRGDGMPFAFVLYPNRIWYEVNFKQTVTPSSEWSIVDLPFSDFIPYQVGRKLDGSISKEELGRIQRIGFISDFKQEADFWIEVSELDFY